MLLAKWITTIDGSALSLDTTKEELIGPLLRVLCRVDQCHFSSLTALANTKDNLD